MSEGISLVNTSNVYKKIDLFQAQTTHFQIDPSLAMRCHESSPDTIPVILRGSKTCKTTIGRGHDATIKIGKANKRVSREHVVIEHKPQIDGFELTILSPNGALIDHIIFVEGEHVPVVEGTTIEIVGTKIIFQVPDESQLVQDMEDVIEETPTADITMEEKGKVDEQKTKQDDTIIPMLTIEQENAAISSIASTTATTTTTTITTTAVNKKNSKNHTKSTINHIIKSTASKLKETARNIIRKPTTLEDEIIQILVYSRKSTMTCTDITKKLQQQQKSENVLEALTTSKTIGCVKRLGKTADGSPKEDLYYYKPELDSDQERQKTYSDVGRSARKCTMKDAQYFFRIPPKLPNHKNTKSRKRDSTNSKKSSQTATEQGDLYDDAKSTSSGDVSDMEVFELFKDV